VLWPATFRCIQRLPDPGLRTAGLEGQCRALFAFQTDGCIESDPVQPSEELGIALETVQRLEGVKKSFLNDILGVFRVVHQSIDAMIQPILIAAHQLPKGRRSPLQTVSDESMIVWV